MWGDPAYVMRDVHADQRWRGEKKKRKILMLAVNVPSVEQRQVSSSSSPTVCSARLVVGLDSHVP